MLNEQPPESGPVGNDMGVDVDHLLTAVASFGEQPDRATLLRRVADAVRDLLGCDEAALIEDAAARADEAGASSGFVEPVRAALLACARTSAAPVAVAGRDLVPGQDSAPAETWAVAPLPDSAAPRALVAAWRTGRDPEQRELRALGVVARWASAAIELRERRTAVAASLQASEEFVSAAAHELRTPLTPLRLTVDRAARALDALDDRDRARGALAHVDEHLRRMTHLVDTLLETSRVARGDLVLVRRDTDLVALVEEVRERYAEAARQNGCSLTLDASERIVGRWDSQRLREAIAQLVGNAVKFGRGSPVRIAVSRVHEEVRVVVTDGGTGIGAHDQERIFERFERAVSVRNFAGLGVGLWLAREIARAHGGDVTVESAPGEGASFTLRLPAAAAHADGERPASRRPRHLRARAAR